MHELRKAALQLLSTYRDHDKLQVLFQSYVDPPESARWFLFVYCHTALGVALGQRV